MFFESPGDGFTGGLGGGRVGPVLRVGPGGGGAFATVELTALTALPEGEGLAALAGADGETVTSCGFCVAGGGGDVGAGGGSAR